MKRHFFLCLLSAAWVTTWVTTWIILSSSTALAEDLILRKGGKTTRVYQVTKASYSNVSYIPREGLQEQTLPRDSVRRIRFGDTPQAFTAGVELLRKGDFQTAIKAFKEARTDPNVRTWWASVWCQLHTAEAYVGWAIQTKHKGRAAEAVKIVSAVFTEFPDNFFKPNFQELYLQALIASGDPRKAVGEADKFEKESSSWSEKTWYLKAKLLGAKAMEAAQLYSEAVSKLDTLVTFARSNKHKDWANEAQILKAKVMRKQGNKDKALNEFRALVRQIDSTWNNRAAAAADIGLGQVLLDDFGKPHEARENLLTARVVYFGTDKKDLEIMAEASYHLGQVCEALAKKGESGAKIEAGRYYQEILDQYNTTAWVSKAKEGLKRVRG